MEYFFEVLDASAWRLWPAFVRVNQGKASWRLSARTDLRSSLEVQEPVAISEPTRKWGIYFVCH